MTIMTSFSSKSMGNNTGSRILHSCNSKSTFKRSDRQDEFERSLALFVSSMP
jgi:hypothetical protein